MSTWIMTDGFFAERMVCGSSTAEAQERAEEHKIADVGRMLASANVTEVLRDCADTRLEHRLGVLCSEGMVLPQIIWRDGERRVAGDLVLLFPQIKRRVGDSIGQTYRVRVIKI